MNPFDKKTRSKLAACEALGLSYWADHPINGRVWAVDTGQQAHIVRIRYKDGTAAIQSVNRFGSTYNIGTAAGFEA